MKILQTLILLMLCLNLFSQSKQIELEHGLKAGTLSKTDVAKLESIFAHKDNIDLIVKTLASEATSEAVKLVLIEKYLQPENLKHNGLKKWTIENLSFELDRNLFEPKISLCKFKLPVLYFLANQDDDELFNVEVLMDSKLMADCHIFEDAYHKMNTCKLLAEVIVSSDGFKFDKYADRKGKDCSYDNYQKISELCMGISIKK